MKNEIKQKENQTSLQNIYQALFPFITFQLGYCNIGLHSLNFKVPCRLCSLEMQSKYTFQL